MCKDYAISDKETLSAFVYIIKYNSQDVKTCTFMFISRYCETGIYKGFFKQNFEMLVGDIIKSHNITKIFSMRIFNDWDVHAKNYQRSKSKKGRL